jgi:hypothetical protein
LINNEIEEIILLDATVMEKDRKRLEYKFKHEEKLILYNTDLEGEEREEALKPLRQAASELGYHLIDIRELIREGEGLVFVKDEVTGKHVVLKLNVWR